MDQLIAVVVYILTMIVLTFIVWVAAEAGGAFIKDETKRIESRVLMSIILGPVVGVSAHGVGFLSVPMPESPFAWVFAAVMGLLCSLGAKLLNDWGINPLKTLAKKFK